MSNVLVIGSANTDLVINVPRLPKPGETLLGGSFFSAAGGKGANQAVAAARAGAQVEFVTRVGRDEYGHQTLEGLSREAIKTTYTMPDLHLPSGLAFILVDAKGENCIAVASGANLALSPAQLEAAIPAFDQAEICLLQLETPLPTVSHAVELAHERNLKVILNPAPAVDLPDELFAKLFLLTPNETETEILTGIYPDSDDKALSAARLLQERGVNSIIITCGERGALLVSPDSYEMIPAPSVDVVDTTAAGDAFNGALACALSEGKSLEEATLWANCAGALTVSGKGAQPSLPSRTQIQDCQLKLT